MLLGTIIPLIIAGVLIFLLLRNRKGTGEEAEAETPSAPEMEDQTVGQVTGTVGEVPVVYQGHVAGGLQPSYPTVAEQTAPFNDRQQDRQEMIQRIETPAQEQPAPAPDGFPDLFSEQSPPVEGPQSEEVVR